MVTHLIEMIIRLRAEIWKFPPLVSGRLILRFIEVVHVVDIDSRETAGAADATSDNGDVCVLSSMTRHQFWNCWEYTTVEGERGNKQEREKKTYNAHAASTSPDVKIQVLSLTLIVP